MTNPATRSIAKTTTAFAAPAAGAAALLAIGAATGGVHAELGSLPGPGTPGLHGASAEHHQRRDEPASRQTAPAPPAAVQLAASTAPAPGPRVPAAPRQAVRVRVHPDRVRPDRAAGHIDHPVLRRTHSTTPVGVRRPHAPAPTTPTTRPQPVPPHATGGAGLPAAPPQQPQPAPVPQPQPVAQPQSQPVVEPQPQPGPQQPQGGGEPQSGGDDGSIPQGPGPQSQSDPGQGSNDPGSNDPSSTGNS
jgi:hypothetical protein